MKQTTTTTKQQQEDTVFVVIQPLKLLIFASWFKTKIDVFNGLQLN